MYSTGGARAQGADGARVGGPVHGHAGRAVHGGAGAVRRRAVRAVSGTVAALLSSNYDGFQVLLLSVIFKL